jgi:peptide deformylase
MTTKIYSHFVEEEDKILRKISTEVKTEEFNSEETKKIIDSMFQFITEQPDGAGLSAPQIGINKRIFVINPKMFDYDKDGNEKPKNKKKEECVFINTKILKSSKETAEIEEGCFSVR